jgi:hypothetical protein
MTSTQALSSSEMMVRISTQTSVTGESLSFVGAGTTTAQGAAGGTTVLDGLGLANSGSADTYNGRYWVRIESGASKGEMRRVVDDNASGTLTVEGNGFENMIDTGIEYTMWLDSDAGVVVCDGDTASTTQFNDDVRDEADSHWVGYYAIPITGSLDGEVQKVTAFDQAGGASDGLFTVEAFSAAPATADVLLLRKYIEVQNLSDGRSTAYHPTPSSRINLSRGDGRVGAKGPGPLSFETHLYASNSLAASGSTANASVLTPLLQAAGLIGVIDTSSTVGAGSSTTALKLDTASHENHTIGSAVIVGGEMRAITAKTDGGAGVDTLTVSPAFSFTPQATDTAYAVRMYRKPTDATAVYGPTTEAEHDGMRTTYFGCKGNAEIIDGEPVLVRWTFSYEHFVTNREAASENPQAATTAGYTTADPVMAHEKRAWVGTTATDIGGFTCTPGTQVAPRNVSGRYGINGRAGHQVMSSIGGGTFNKLIESGSLAGDGMEDFLRRTSRALLVVWNTHGRAVGMRQPAARLISGPHDQDLDGMRARPHVYESQDAGTASDPTDGTVKVPDFALFLP